MTEVKGNSRKILALIHLAEDLSNSVADDLPTGVLSEQTIEIHAEFVQAHHALAELLQVVDTKVTGSGGTH